MYVNDVQQKICEGGATPTIEKESVSTALVNGNNGLGPVVGDFCMELAVKKAKETGIGWVCARGKKERKFKEEKQRERKFLVFFVVVVVVAK